MCCKISNSAKQGHCCQCPRVARGQAWFREVETLQHCLVQKESYFMVGPAWFRRGIVTACFRKRVTFGGTDLFRK